MRVTDPVSGISIDLGRAGGTFCAKRPPIEGASCDAEVAAFLDDVAPANAWAVAYVDTGNVAFAVLGNTLSSTGTRISEESLESYARDWVGRMNAHLGPSTNITPGTYVALHNLDAPAVYFDVRLDDREAPMLWRVYTVFAPDHPATIVFKANLTSDGPFQEAAEAIASSIEAPTVSPDGFNQPSLRPEHLLRRPIVWVGAAIMLLAIYRLIVMLRARRNGA